MRRHLVTAIAASVQLGQLSACSRASAPPDQRPRDSDMALMDSGTTKLDTASELVLLRDEFNTIDPQRWSKGDWFLGETQLVAGNAEATEGILSLSHHWEAAGWRGAELYSTDTFLYGSWRARMRAPEDSGTVCAFFFYASHTDGGTWTANEIDFELVGGELQVGTFQEWTLDDGYEDGPARRSVTWGPETDFDPSSFHIYALDWSPGLAVFHVDDEEVARFEDVVPAVALSVRFNHWTSETWEEVGYPPPPGPITCEIDWLAWGPRPSIPTTPLGPSRASAAAQRRDRIDTHHPIIQGHRQ